MRPFRGGSAFHDARTISFCNVTTARRGAFGEEIRMRCAARPL
jgi:hypothetical protein